MKQPKISREYKSKFLANEKMCEKYWKDRKKLIDEIVDKFCHINPSDIIETTLGKFQVFSKHLIDEKKSYFKVRCRKIKGVKTPRLLRTSYLIDTRKIINVTSTTGFLPLSK